MSEKCPFCGERFRLGDCSPGRMVWWCATFQDEGSPARQSKLCNRLTALAAEVESLRVNINASAVREGKLCELLGIKPGDDLEKAVKALLSERDYYYDTGCQ